ncbi:hypothetical protein BHM03_00044583, partial [Ensete ventricosum]
GKQASSIAAIHVKFVLCRLTKAEQRVLIALEILRFEDVIVLKCTENMNAGKTYTYFSSLTTVLPHRCDYVMKADDDAFIRLAAVAAALRPLHRSDLWYGAAVPCASRDPSAGYMSSMGSCFRRTWCSGSRRRRSRRATRWDRRISWWGGG